MRPKLGSRDDEKLVERCRDMFEKYCIVTQSIRDGMPVTITVEAEYEN